MQICLCCVHFHTQNTVYSKYTGSSFRTKMLGNKSINYSSLILTCWNFNMKQQPIMNDVHRNSINIPSFEDSSLLWCCALSIIDCWLSTQHNIQDLTVHQHHCANLKSSTIVPAFVNMIKLTKLRGLSPHANYTDRAAAAGRRS